MITPLTKHMYEKQETLLRLSRASIMLLIALLGVACFFLFPEQGLYMSASCTFIAFSYFTLLHYPKRQLLEFCILLSVLTTTAYAYFSTKDWAQWLFLSQLLYFAYGMGKAFIFKELKSTFKYFTQLHARNKHE